MPNQSDVKSVSCRLKELGWIKKEGGVRSASSLEPYLLLYQAFHGLDLTGYLDPVTEKHLYEPRFCGHPDMMTVENSSCAWPFKEVRCRLNFSSLGRLGSEALRSSLEEACRYWNQVCGIQLTISDDRPHIVLTAGRIDGPSGTLAWSEMPCGNTRSLTQKYDTSEVWVVAENPGGGYIDIVRVLAHEIGHAIGIPHISSGNLMAPSYNPRIRRPQSGDIIEATRRYGEKPQSPDPDIPSVPGDPDTIGDCADILKAFLASEEGQKLTRAAVKFLIDVLKSVRS